MQKHQELAVRMFGSVVSYVDAHPELVADTPQGRAFAARVAALRSIIAAVRGAAASQVTATSQSRVEDGKEPELKRQLRNVHLRGIATVARGLSATVPGIGVLRLPPAGLRKAALIARATSFAEQARIYQTVLAEHGLAPDAVDQLERAIVAFSNSVASRRDARTSLVGATHAVRDHLVTGRAIVTAMDGVIHILYNGHDDALAAWRSAKRVGRAQRGPLSLDVESLSTSAESAPTLVQSGSTAARSASLMAQTPSSLVQSDPTSVETAATAVQSVPAEVTKAA